MIAGSQFVELLARLEVTHVVWLPDSALGTWEHELEQAPGVELVRVCREGEAWALAAGLILGGRQPLVVMQSTGLFESGDALRNVAFDLRLPVLAVIGCRSYLLPNSADSARRFVEPIVNAWGLDYVLAGTAGPGADEREEIERIAGHLESCRRAAKPGLVLVAEGKG